MVAFGDMILFIFVTGFFSLVPTWFLLKLLVATAPRTLLGLELLIAAIGPVSWLAMLVIATNTPPGGPSRLPNWPQAAVELLGLFLAFGAVPRIALGPVFVVIEGVTFFLFRTAAARAVLVADANGRCSHRALCAAFCTDGPLLGTLVLRSNG